MTALNIHRPRPRRSFDDRDVIDRVRYVDRGETELVAWSTRLEVLTRTLHNVERPLTPDSRRVLSRLEQKLARAWAGLRRLKRAPSRDWAGRQSAFEEARDDFTESFERAI